MGPSNQTPLRDWRKSSYSTANQENCVEVAELSDGTVGVRDSKNPGGGHLAVARTEWAALIGGIKAGRL